MTFASSSLDYLSLMKSIRFVLLMLTGSTNFRRVVSLLYNNVYGIRALRYALRIPMAPDACEGYAADFYWVSGASLLEGTPIKVFGDGEQLRDFNYC